MNHMFYQASAFNQPLNNWDVSSVTDMLRMFYQASAFNQPLNNWDVSSVTNMIGMFERASAFNQPLNNWDVSKVTVMGFMFTSTSAFDQPLNSWDVSKVTNMIGMFERASAFNQPLDNWDVSKVTHMGPMFHGASAFSQTLSCWNFRTDVDTFYIFNGSPAASLTHYITKTDFNPHLQVPPSVQKTLMTVIALVLREVTSTVLHVPRPSGTVSTEGNSAECTPCPAGSYPSADQKRCIVLCEWTYVYCKFMRSVCRRNICIW